MKYYRSAEEVEVVEVLREAEQGSEEEETKKKKSKGRKRDDGGTDTAAGKGLEKKGEKAAREQKRTVKYKRRWNAIQVLLPCD
jgi:hypothetical protein